MALGLFCRVNQDCFCYVVTLDTLSLSEKVMKLLDIAKYAPSGGNLQRMLNHTIFSDLKLIK